MNDPRLRAFLKKGMGRMRSVRPPRWREVLDSLQPIGQLPFVEDMDSGAIAKAGRGAGKSYGMACKYHAPSAAHPGCSSVFITQSITRSRDILLPGIWKLNEKFKIGIAEVKKDDAIVWPNGYRVLMRGCKDRSEANKRRGTPWVVAGWDECDAINSKLLEYDIHECVEPRLADYNGYWFAGGTPGAVLQGYWYALSGGENEHCRVHEWDARTNPHMPDVRAYFIKVLNRMGGIPPREEWPEGVESLDDILREPKHWHLLPATFVREYLGKWVTDLKALIYRITPRNTFRDLPLAPDRWTIGVDLGGHNSEDPDLDHAAITVACSNATLPFIWVLESFRLSDITTDTLAAKLSQLMQHYPEATIYIDSSSAGKIIENTFRKMSLPIRAALKGPKLRRIQLLQSAIANGNLQLHILDTMDLREESQLLVWDETRADHAARCADDCWDSAHYACIPHFGDYQPEENPIEPGTKEYERQQEMAEYEEALSEAMDDAGIEDLRMAA